MLLNLSPKDFFFFPSSFCVDNYIHNSIFGFIFIVLSSGTKAAVSWEPQS